MNALTRLQQWFARQHNDKWQDGELEIKTFTNPCWFVKINLQHTTLDGVEFTEVAEGVGDAPLPQWINCYVEENVWKGAGDEAQLERILEVFLSWAEANERSATT